MDSASALDLATAAVTFIESAQAEGAAEKRVDSTLYHGSAGVILFLLEVANATEDDALWYRAIDQGSLLADYLRTKESASVSFATGWPGYSFVMQVLYQRTRNPEFLEAAVFCMDRLMAGSQPLGSGIGWIEPMPFSDITGFIGDREIFDLSVGAAGAAVGLLDAHRNDVHPMALPWAVSVANRLLEVAEETPDGLRWGLMANMPFPFTAPNFAHGGAGVGYFMAQLYSATFDERFLQAAISAGNYVMSRAVTITNVEREVENAVENAALVCHTEEQKPPMFYLGECHGPAGTWRLLATLARLTGDSKWTQSARILLNGVLAIGAPECRSDGWWNNHSQCCGDAGLGDSALSMFDATGDADYLDLAHRCADVIASAAERNEVGAAWTQAEHRARPKFLQTQTGYMQGAAGIGSFLIHLATHGTKNPVRIVFPDEHL
jgi:lantibiotic modifying enzyme